VAVLSIGFPATEARTLVFLPLQRGQGVALPCHHEQGSRRSSSCILGGSFLGGNLLISSLFDSSSSFGS
jgi:hypothetical protein